MTEPQTAGRTIRWLITLGVITALLVPVARDHDSFPLSTYPMYAHNRDREVAVATVVGVADDDTIIRLGLTTIADSDDPLEAAALVRGEVRSGRADQLCRAVAARVEDPTLTIEVTTETHDTVARARGQPSLIGREIHARCAVGR